jgi:hypothetical protein
MKLSGAWAWEGTSWTFLSETCYVFLLSVSLLLALLISKISQGHGNQSWKRGWCLCAWSTQILTKSCPLCYTHTIQARLLQNQSACSSGWQMGMLEVLPPSPHQTIPLLVFTLSTHIYVGTYNFLLVFLTNARILCLDS